MASSGSGWSAFYKASFRLVSLVGVAGLGWVAYQEHYMTLAGICVASFLVMLWLNFLTT